MSGSLEPGTFIRGRITDEEIDNLQGVDDVLAAAVDPVIPKPWWRPSSRSTVPSTGWPAGSSSHDSSYMWRGRYRHCSMPPTGLGADAVDNRRNLITALRARDVTAAVEHTTWQLTDGANRLTALLERSGIWR